MAASERALRRGPAPIASFDHDVSDESSPETKQVRLPEIRETAAGAALAPPAARARSHSSPGPAPGLATPAPRIDISRASSSSHHDSRDSSPELPELALLAGGAPRGDSLGFREDGALDLRSSTEELAFLEQPAAAPPPAPRRPSRRDSQGSEAALLAISGRTSRLSSVGSQGSAVSALSHASNVSFASAAGHAAGPRLSVVSGVSRSPSPHKMLLETSFCGPKPIENDPEVCAAAVEERLLELAKLQAFPAPSAPAAASAAPAPATPAVPPVAPVAPAQGDARDRREVRAEVTVEAAPAPSPQPARPAARRDAAPAGHRSRGRERRGERPEVYKPRNRSKDVIRIKLKPDDADDDDEGDNDDEEGELAAGAAHKPETLALRSPSPALAPPSRKSSFCSLFKSRETIGSPDSPSDAMRRKKSLNEGSSRSKSRDRDRAASAASGKLRGSVLSLFRTPRRSTTSPSPSPRATSPAPAAPGVPPPAAQRGLKYYEDSRDGVIHIPLRTPPDEPAREEAERRSPPRPASAPCTRAAPAAAPATPAAPAVPTQRTVLPDGSIIIPLHSPTERAPPSPSRPAEQRAPAPTPVTPQPETSRSISETSRPISESSRPMSVSSVSGSPESPAAAAAAGAAGEAARGRRKERLVFTTHVGSAEQVFSTQFSITKTPSVSSEISASFPSLPEERVLRDTHITADAEPAPSALADATSLLGAEGAEGAASPAAARSPGGETRDSSESEGSAEPRGPDAEPRGSDAEQRGLVVQESFEELPYVPTTLPQERSLALPMLPVRERRRQLQTTAVVERPRSARAAPLVAPPAPPDPPAAPPRPRLTIRLPRRASAAPATTAPAATVTAATVTATTTTATDTSRRSRARSTGDGGAARAPAWIDFSEVPERRAAARRIQTLPAREPEPCYVEPDQCRCECHHHTQHGSDGEQSRAAHS